jgi:ADP-ribose pyrophosphatase YjhB (NUDIX family)
VKTVYGNPLRCTDTFKFLFLFTRMSILNRTSKNIVSRASPDTSPAAHMSTVTCANCGRLGHIYRFCNQPVISYGVICFRLLDKGGTVPSIEYLLVQRKDTFSFVEFMRGKYDLKNKAYILNMFQTMTHFERQLVSNNSFEQCWKHLWSNIDRGKKWAEYSGSKAKFESLKNGYLLSAGPALTTVSVGGMVKECNDVTYEPEWGFPKGRRNINESDMKAAFREFFEETAIPTESFCLLSHKPFEEVFTGSNGVRYKHIYFLARLDCKAAHAEVSPQELRAAQWMSYQDAISKFPDNVERMEMFGRIHRFVEKQPPLHK